MSENNLLLPGAKTAILVSSHPRPSHWLRNAAIALGIFSILVGGADILTRFSQRIFGSCTTIISFGPAISASDPSIAQSGNGTTPCK